MSRVEQIVIIGAGDHGRGTLEILLASRDDGRSLEVVGFLDDVVSKHGTTVGGVPVLGGLDWLTPARCEDVRLIIGVADCARKRAIVERLATLPATFTSAIHPLAHLARGVSVSPGAVINAGVAIAYDSTVGPHTTINLNATIGHDCSIGRYSTVAPGANIAGHAKLEDGCDIGPNATIVRGVLVGEWSFVGPATVIVRDIAAGARMFGNPARMVPATTAVGR